MKTTVAPLKAIQTAGDRNANPAKTILAIPDAPRTGQKTGRPSRLDAARLRVADPNLR
jgi:hypothetical protein